VASRRIAWVDINVARPDAETRRLIVDVRILAALGRFFAGKLRSAVWYELHAETGDRGALREAIEYLSSARQAWLDASDRASVYMGDLTFGPEPRLRGHWTDRLPAIDADLQDMRERLGSALVPAAPRSDIVRLVAVAERTRAVDVDHSPPETFRPGEPLLLRVAIRGDDADRVTAVRVRYRPMNHALAFSVREMHHNESAFATKLPAAGLTGDYPLAYAFEIHDVAGTAGRHPGLGETLSDPPYFVVRPEHS
jgi:hypothetical protein